ncbi:apolipoprotein N-acyltransferase [Mucisphaera sp.]|uniref:apolipoprotein N-acyltransferase n=1 Tax=Mucisphaera sp. TaxID=2913024 RepID=UPI003D0F7795
MAKKEVAAPVKGEGPASLLEHFWGLGLSAVLLGVIYPVLGWWWLAYVALVPGALVVSRSASFWRVLWVSVVVFWVWWVVMLNWVMPVTVGGTIAMGLVLSVFPAVGFLLIRRLSVGGGGRLALTWAVPIAWVLVEFLRSRLPFGGLSWFFLGHSQGPWLPEHSAVLIQTADLFGELTVTAFVALLNGFAADVIRRSFTAPDPEVVQERLRKRFVARVVSVGVVVALVVGHGWLWTDHARYGLASTTGVVVIQTNEPQSNRQSPSLEDRIGYWHALLDETRLAVEGQRDESGRLVVIWPESAVPMPIDAGTLAMAEQEGWAAITAIEGQIRDLAVSYGVDLLVGAPSYGTWETVDLDGVARWLPGEGANSVFHYRSDGSRAAERYDKMHRVPFGEYLPLVDGWPWLKGLVLKYLTPYETSYTIEAGDAPVVFEVAGWSVVTPICFEDTVGRVVREMVRVAREALDRPALLVNVTNDGWFGSASQGFQHLQVAAFRCVENRVPMAKAANTGVSGFISSLGEVVSIVEVDGESKGVQGHASMSLGPRLNPPHVSTWHGLYEVWGETPLVLLAVVVGWLGSGGRRGASSES